MESRRFKSFKEELESLKDCSWLEYRNIEPLPETLAAIKEAMDKGAEYPMVPGFEIPYYRDTTPQGWLREDFKTGGGIEICAFIPESKPKDSRVI